MGTLHAVCTSIAISEIVPFIDDVAGARNDPKEGDGRH